MNFFKYLFLIICLGFNSFVFLQEEEGATFNLQKQSKVKEKSGVKYLSLYYGMPHLEKSWQTSMFKSLTVDNLSIKDVNSNGFGPIGLKAEYFVSNSVGLGFDAFYNTYNINFKDVYQIYDPTYTFLIDVQDQYKYTMERLRIHFRANFYFKLKDPSVQLYGGVGLGLNYRNISFRKNGQKEVEITSYLKNASLVLPISARICFGYRQVLYNKFAISFETGLGGPLFSLGLSYQL